MVNIVEQNCIIRAVKSNGSNFVLSLEPKKEKCPTCDGKCVKMMKKPDLIDIETSQKDFKEGEIVVIYMEKSYLFKLIAIILGIPLFIVVVLVCLGKVFNFSDLFTLLLVVISLFISFLAQVKMLKISKQLCVKKI